MVSDKVLVGRIIAPFGLTGATSVKILSDVPQRFAAGARIYVNETPMEIQYSRPSNRHLVVKFIGVDSRSAAEDLRNLELHIKEDQTAPLPENIYYHFQLLGLEVLDSNGCHLGILTDIMETGANDVYVVTSTDKETLIPAIHDYVTQIDLPNRRMIVNLG